MGGDAFFRRAANEQVWLEEDFFPRRNKTADSTNQVNRFFHFLVNNIFLIARTLDDRDSSSH
jgi:hypothetical protein